MNKEEIIIINNEPFYRIQNGTSYDYAPIPKEFKPYFDRLQQEIERQDNLNKQLVEQCQIFDDNWNKLKKWLEEYINLLEQNDIFDRTLYGNGELSMLEIVLTNMQELEKGKSE